MYRYRAVPQKSFIGNCVTYGLLAEELSADEWIAIAIIPDVSCDGNFVSRLADRCSRGQLAPCQMLDVVLDALLL